MSESTEALPPRVRVGRSGILWASLAIFAIALLVRWPHLSQGLWLDEMTTLLDYVHQPWQRVLAAKPGEYLPNNHVLHTVLAKVAYSLGSHGDTDTAPPNERLLRLPALLGGCLLPIVLAWPLRRTAPLLALTIALIAAMHPWLVAFSTEARGYSLLLLLAIVATNLLPDGRQRWPIAYAIVMAAAIYTVPIALLLIPAHVVAMLVSRATRGNKEPDRSIAAFARGAAIAVALSIILYLPVTRGMLQYYRRPFETTITYRELLDQLPRFALAGERLPRRLDPVMYLPDPPTASVYWALPVLAIIVGSALGRTRAELRPALITFGVATLLGLLLALVSPAAVEVRFVPWIAPWFILAVAGILAGPPQRWARVVAMVAIGLILTWMGLRDATMLPNEPVREAIRQADELAPPGERIVLTYLGAMEAAQLYGGDASAHEIGFAHDLPHLLAAEERSLVESTRRPWLIVPYEDLMRRRNNGAPETRGMWTHLVRNYRLVTRLPGRITPVAIYAPRDARVAVAMKGEDGR